MKKIDVSSYPVVEVVWIDAVEEGGEMGCRRERQKTTARSRAPQQGKRESTPGPILITLIPSLDGGGAGTYHSRL